MTSDVKASAITRAAGASSSKPTKQARFKAKELAIKQEMQLNFEMKTITSEKVMMQRTIVQNQQIINSTRKSIRSELREDGKVGEYQARYTGHKHRRENRISEGLPAIKDDTPEEYSTEFDTIDYAQNEIVSASNRIKKLEDQM